MELWDIYDRQRRTTGRFHVRGTPMGRGEYHLTAFVWVFNRQRELLLTRRAAQLSQVPAEYLRDLVCLDIHGATYDELMLEHRREVRAMQAAHQAVSAASAPSLGALGHGEGV